MGRVILTGASGFVGSNLLRTFVSEGRDAIGLVRPGRPGAAAGLPTRTLATWEPGPLRDAFVGADAVVHAASVVHRPDAPLREYERFNVDGTLALVDACIAAGVRRLVLLSSIKVYGEATSGVLDEGTPVAADGGYASTKVDAERIALAAPGLAPVVLRLAPVFGPGDKGNVRTMIRAIRARRFLLPGDGRTRKSLVHVSTVADVVRAALDSQATGTFVVADRDAPSMRELADAIAHAVCRGRPLAVPVELVRAAARALELVAHAAGRAAPISPALIDKSLTPTVCSPAKVEATFGVRCHVNLQTALREEVAWMRGAGLL